MSELFPREGERLDDLQLCGMKILQKEKGFRFGMDAVLLADFFRARPSDTVADFGTGTGVLPLLLYGRGKGRRFLGFELQADMAEMASRTMRLNRLEDTVQVFAAPVEEAPALLGPRSVDAVICNPPYGAPGSTLKNPDESRALSRHQGEEGLAPWCRAASAVLKDHGRFAMVYPAPQMLQAMRQLEEAGLTPKRLRLVCPKITRPPNLALIEAVKGGKPFLQHEPPLVVFSEDGEWTRELKRIYGLENEAATQ